MRRVDAEGDSRGGQVQKQAETRSRSRLRRAAIEWLERREMLSTSTSTLPSPTVLVPPASLAAGGATVSSPTALGIGGPALTAHPYADSPSVSVDPINPLEMVAVWVDHDAAGYQPGGLTEPITNYIEGSYSTDGGNTWTALSLNSVNIQQDFSETPPTTSFYAFTQTTNASVAFDRSENFYILSSTHNDANSAGVLDVERFSFPTGAAQPTALGTTPVYSWDETDSKGKGGSVDQALTPTMAVDTNVPTFTDPTTGKVQADKFSGNIYVAWAEIDSNTYDNGIPEFNPNTIRMAASSDQGVNFTNAAYVDDTSNANIGEGHSSPTGARYTAPQLTISQGNVSGTVTPGQVTLVYDDYGTQAPIDRILDQTDVLGGTSEQFSPAANLLGASTFATTTINGTTVISKQNLNQDIPITVNIADAKFTTLQTLTVTTTIDYAAMKDLTVTLIPPAAVNTYLAKQVPGYGGSITLYNETLSGPNLGSTSGTVFGGGSGTVFDPNAIRSIQDGNTGATAVGHFQPVDESAFLALQGLAAAAKGTLPGLNGTWNFLASYSTAADTSTTLRYVNGVTLNFSSGNDPGSTGSEVTVADEDTLYVVPNPDINPTDPNAATAYPVVHHTDNPLSPYYDGIAGSLVTGNGTITTTTQGNIPLLPAPVIASDNTLGSFSQHEGRIYVSFTGMFKSAQAGNTDIFLLYSDDGGKTWSNAEQVNDDNAQTDGYSAADPNSVDIAGTSTILGRTQYEPQIAVDQSTGDVVLSFLDARNDPSDARVSTYIAVSNDGAATWAPEVYANPTSTALDAVTGNTVNIGPLPDNQSAGSGAEDSSGYGTHQALVVTNGQITAFWSSNQNTVGTANAPITLAIVDSILSLAAGPVIISSSQGPVGVAGDELNTTKASDGTTLANTIQVTFDEPINPATFTAANVAVYYKSPAGGASISLPIVSVTPLDSNQFGAVNFLITFNPASLATTTYGFVGTYSYVIYPTGSPNGGSTEISDRIRHVISGGTVATGNLMDQNANGSPGQPNDDTYNVGQPTTVPVTYKSTAAVAITANATVMSPINVIDNYLIQADNGVIPGVSLTVNITYAKANNLTAFLLAPDGVEIPLFTSTKLTSAGANFTNTTFTDLATTSIDAGTAPFTGSFKPETTFNTLSADGVTSLGTWELVIKNSGALAGSITNWALTFQPPQVSYETGTLPLIVPGPHVTSAVVVNAAGTTISSGNNNLVLNNTVSTLQVTWDRNIEVSSLTPAQILSIYGPAGAVSTAGITITPVSVYTSTGQVAYAGGATASVFDITFPTQQLSGTYTLTLGTGILAFNENGVANTGVDANLNAGLDTLKGTATNGVTTPVTYSTAVSAAITPATVNVNGSTTPSMLMSPINVPIDFPIQPDANGVSGVTLTLNVTYPNDPDLVAYLLSPAGTKIFLFTNIGSGTRTANFTNTTLSDTAKTLISTAGAPFFGTFLPQEAFGTLNTNGEDSQGTWSLVIENEGNSSGTLNSWSLTFQQPTSSTGLGEAADDRTSTSYQIFNLAASNALANSTWTAVGPAGITTVGATTPVSFLPSSTVLPSVISAGSVASPTTLSSPIIVDQDFAILPDTTAISGVTLSLDITNTTAASADISAYLLAPDGTTKITLFTNVDSTAANNTGVSLFSGTTLSDVAGNPIANGTTPFASTFTPESLFNTLFTDGLYTYGTWSLVITNSGTGAATLDDWSLTFQKTAATIAGEVSTVVVDPSDKTGNTVYAGTASGGIWKTSNFLTTNPAGPTWIPLTQFGPNFSLNIGSIAAIGVNNDPSQTILFAGTGFGQEATTSNTGAPNVDLNAGRGVGILRSTDGGVTWTLLDSSVNVDSSGNPLSESLRDHQFVGDTTYKIVVDPKPELNGQYIVYAALGGPTGGLYQSLDSGNTWSLLSGGISGNAGQSYVTCTDIILDPNSKSPTTGNLDTLYAAFSTYGVYVSTNQGQTLQQMVGQLGKNPLIVGTGFPAVATPVENAGVTPNFIDNSYVVLAKPELTGSTAQNLAYQGWLYVAVENGDGTFNGLYVTKDNGENWTLVQLPNIPGVASVKAAVPTNDTTGVNSLDPTADKFTQQGGYDLTLTVDPTDPNIVYIGGTQNFQETGMIRVDLTDLYDAHNFTSFSNDQTDGGLLNVNAQGGVTVTVPANGDATYNPIAGTPIPNILNLRYAPTDPFNINATLVVANTTNFINTGTGATWTLFDEPLKAESGDTIGSTNVHDVIDYIDPITGDVRVLIANDEGIYTTLVTSDGTIDNGIGTDFEVNYSRNGNLQNEQILTSAAQPSFVSTQAAGALFYASGQTDLAAQSDMDILTDGNLTWDNSAVLNPSNSSPRNTAANGSIGTLDRSGVGIATDSTGESNPPAVYEFDIPILGGNLTDFFRVNQFGQTTGLANNVNQEYPRQGSNGDAQVSGYSVMNGNAVNAVNNGQIPVGNFAVNPLNGNQILIGSATGNLYETTDQGNLWSPIGNSANFQVNANSLGDPNTQIQFSTIVYGAPDPNAQGGVGNLNNFIYVGTTGSPLVAGEAPIMEPDGLFQNDGRIFITQAGGQGWTNISSGLDGSSVVGIYPDPDRGSHAAYAVTLTGVFYSPDTVGLAAAGQTVWTNITSNLTSIQYNPFGNATYQQSVLAQFVGQDGNSVTNSNVFTAQYGGFSSIVADYRYEIPAPTNATEGTNIFYPVLYVSGYGGVFRSIDNGVTWTVFPNVDFDAAPVDGGYLPSVDVTNLQLVLGDINPATGHAVQATNDPEILLASTYGAGDYAIRLAPDVIPDSVVLDPNLPVPNGSDSSEGAGITNVLDPYIDGISEVSNYGDTVTINIYDQSLNPDGTPTAGFGTLLGTGTTNQLGQFVVQIIDSGQDATFFTSSTAYNDKTIGIRATDSAGASGNLTLFSYTLDLIIPVTPNAPVLEAEFDTGRFNNDDLTNLSVPPQAGPGAPLSVVTPVFDITTSLPQANPLTPNPISLTIELLSSTSPNGPFFEINSTQTGIISADGTSETYMLTDPTIAALAANGIDETIYYEALQIDEAGNVSQPASDQLAVTYNTIAPAAPTGITLDASTNSGGSITPPYQTDYTNPVFDVTGVLPNDQLLLYRSVNGGAPILVGTGPINNTGSPATLQVTDTLGATSDGVYTYYAAQLDVYGNFSLLTTGILVTINTQQPPNIPILEAGYDTGRFNNDDVTNIAVPAPTPGSTPNFVVPIFDVNTTPPGQGQPAIATVQLFRSATANGVYTLVGSTSFSGTNPAMVTDASLQTLIAQEYAAGTPIDQDFYYEADVIDAAGIESGKSGPLKVLVDTVTPPTLPAPTLDASSSTGLIGGITNQTKPTFDATNLLPGEQLFLYRSVSGNAPILVGTGPINNTGAAINAKVQDTTGAVPDGVYQYYVVQQDLAGNISNFSASIAITVNTTTPIVPTIALEASDDTGLPSHPDVTSVNTPHFVGTAQYNSPTNFPLAIINVATGAVLASIPGPAANGTYLAQITNALADGVYTLEARTENLAGTFSYSAPLTITIKHQGPVIPPNLQILPADDTGIKGDNVTSNHNPKFIGTTDKGDTVSLYVLLSNGVLEGPEATTTSSTINGSFAFNLPFNLTNGVAQLVAQTSDIANNKGPLSQTLTIQIATTAGDYIAIGKAQLTVFDPYNETYYVRNIGSAQVDTTPGRDLPMQYDLNGDGATDLVAYRYNTAEYYGYVSNNTGIDQPFGTGGASLPVSGNYGSSGTYIYGSYTPATGTWAIALPQPGGLVVNFGLPMIDIPTPAAYNGYGSTELAVFRNLPFFGGDADSFSVIGPQGFYEVSFTSPAVQALGFTYKPGDIAAPADYDGVGRTEFAIYRPSTGQFFILNTPSDTNTATWTLRTVTLNLPGGPNVNDVPVSEDYDGDGKADPTVYRPSNSTFYILSSSTGLQSNIAFGAPGQSVAAAGPILYRLSALFGSYSSSGGYYSIITTAGGGGVTALSVSGSGGGGIVHSEAIASPASSTSPAPAASSSTSSTSLSTLIAVAAPIAVTTTPTPPASVVSLTTPTASVTVGVSTPRTFVPVVTSSKATPTTKVKAHKETKLLVVDSRSHEAETKAQAEAKSKAEAAALAKSHTTAPVKTDSAKAKSRSLAKAAAFAAASLQHLVMAKKGGKKN